MVERRPPKLKGHMRCIGFSYKIGDNKCILGHLACNAGITTPEWMDNGKAIYEVPYFARRLEEVYGISLKDLEYLQKANDYAFPELKKKLVTLGLADESLEVEHVEID